MSSRERKGERGGVGVFKGVEKCGGRRVGEGIACGWDLWLCVGPPWAVLGSGCVLRGD